LRRNPASVTAIGIAMMRALESERRDGERTICDPLTALSPFLCATPAWGSSILFDYIDHSIVENAGRHGEVANLRRYRGLTGEGLTFGIQAGTIDTFLEQRGLVRVKVVRAEDLHRLYFTGPRQDRAVASQPTRPRIRCYWAALSSTSCRRRRRASSH
jgi:O-methyltransferase involved in polyketide biosynthesis